MDGDLYYPLQGIWQPDRTCAGNKRRCYNSDKSGKSREIKTWRKEGCIQKNKGSQPFLFREKVHLNSLTENTNSGMLWTEEQQIFTFAGGAAQTAKSVRGGSTFISPDLDHASVGKRDLQTSSKRAVLFLCKGCPPFFQQCKRTEKKERGTVKTKKMAISAMFIAVGV